MMTSATAMPIDVSPGLHFSGYTTTTTTSLTDHDDHRCNWNHWSPLVNWDSFTAGQDDFHDLIESMMDPDNSSALEEEGSTSTTTSTEVNMVDLEENNFKGLKLVHLLMAAAEALNKSRVLARLILVRLKELVSPTDGTNMERLAAYFTDALQGLLEGAAGGGCGEHNKHFTSNRFEYHHHHTDMLAAFQLLQDMCPYVKFGHFTANQAILEAVAHDGRVHIVDYDIMEGIQWASFMEALASRKDGPPAPHLRITALSRGGSGSSSGRGHRSIATVQETGRRLTEFAASLGQPFSFHQCRLDSDGTFRPSSLKLVRGEALVFNCVLNLPHQSYRSPDSVASFLNWAKTLNPRLVTLVEEEAGTTGDVGFVGRFMDSLHHYSAVYDSLENGFPMQNRSRTLVERVFLGPRIAASLAGIYRTGREEERGWCGQWLRGNGFKGVSISFGNHCQAKLLAGLFNDGYRVEELGSNKLVLGWKSRRLLSASVWSSSSSSDTSAQT